LITRDNFLSQLFNKNCGNAKLEEIKEKKELEEFTFVYSKSAYSQEMSIKAKNLNFYLAEISVNLIFKNDNVNFQSFEGELANNSNAEEIENLAFNSFVFDRFHKDPNIPNSIASEIKKQWVRNFFLGKRGDKCFIKRSSDGKVIGFLLSNITNENIKIDLLAVDKNHRGRGLGKSLINDFFNFYRNQNKNFMVSTQIDNSRSIRIYESIGFTKLSNQLVWHHTNEN
tara:strand:- start:225 stop:905 length:681 start_codon:yes stop_codon:yes gene_type:complete